MAGRASLCKLPARPHHPHGCHHHPRSDRFMPRRGVGRGANATAAIVATVEMARDFEAAAASDDLSHTVNYDAVCQRLIGFGEAGRKLIETLAVTSRR